ncbi:MAG: glycosyltransferase [Anaerolineaceae bacterium]|nr:glycosyltransferase [Anaerolineaceae bacterium]
MRVIYFSRDFTAHDHRFLCALAKTDHKVYFLRLERPAVKREERALPKGISEISWYGGKEPFAYRHSIRYMKDLKRVIKQYQPDLIHAGPIQTCAFLTAQCGFQPLVSMSWGSDLLMEADKDEQMLWVTQYTLDRTQVLVGDCQAVSDKAQTFGFPAERITLFPWGVDLDQFHPGKTPALREQFKWQENPLFLSLRSWEPIYGIDVLIEGFAKAVKKNNAIRLLLLGNGSQKELIESLIKQNELEAYIFQPGYVQQQELIEYYQAADIYISSSFSDGSSVSLMEALACGLPVLVSDIPGNMEWVTSDEQGWLYGTGMADLLADGILNAIDLRNKWPEMSIKARQLAEQRANWQKNFQSLLLAYNQALQIKSEKHGDTQYGFNG